ncbi:LAMI_0D11628g1_1 [Lachancea mirantina]|uniref:Kinesin-like protein n=1 Tax=Lachancea mirantina TaxID=1230905 RepID=A0A1G4JFB1_9SACH|nr:LAMI_0D11628g1_1 [Lachancea mirantina]
MSDKIKVAIRIRAPAKERPKNGAVKLVSPNEVSVTQINGNDTQKRFIFDQCFEYTEDTSQDQLILYQALARDYLLYTLDGYNTCIFAYGQTGSGKSHTITGSPESPGIIYRICEELFEVGELYEGSENGTQTRFTIHHSYFEIYNEQVRDLLGVGKCRIREKADKTTFVEGLKEFEAKNREQILDSLKRGNELRTTGSTNANEHSSRSHAIFTISITQTEISPLGEIFERRSSIRLVDLAGSERASATGSRGDRLKEGSNINKSLSSLGRVISVLAKKNQTKLVPYRDSALTWVLKENLGGNSKTCMIACVSPSDFEETMSTLRYANIASHIVTEAHINACEATQDKEQFPSMKTLIDELQVALSQLKDQKLIQDQMRKIKLTNRFLESTVEREKNLKTEYYDQCMIISRQRDQLSNSLYGILSDLSIQGQDDTQEAIRKLQERSTIFKSLLDADWNFWQPLPTQISS